MGAYISCQNVNYKHSISAQECLSISLSLVGMTKETVLSEIALLRHIAESLWVVEAQKHALLDMMLHLSMRLDACPPYTLHINQKHPTLVMFRLNAAEFLNL